MPAERTPYSEIHTERFRTPEPSVKSKWKEYSKKHQESVVYKGHDRAVFREYIEAVQDSEARKAFEKVCAFAEAVHEAGGRALLVGGSVRDEVLGTASKDFDMEVYGLEPDAIENLAKKFGRVDAVGKAFGVLKVTVAKGIDLDLSLPRVDSKIGAGHRGFKIKVDPYMGINEAARRRDFTFNALMKDPLTGEIFDPFGGVKDLQSRILRVTDAERFKDDPLRVLRGAQFVGRFGLRVESASLEIMRGMVGALAELPKERVKEEWDKLLLKAVRPSMGLQLLFDLGVIETYYPELAALKSTPQEFDWHPEGDVWVHTLMVADAAAVVIRGHGLEDDAARTVMYGALCHDLGKPMTTVEEEGRLRAKGHEPEGEKPTRDFLERLGQPKRIVDAVIAIVKDHLWPSTAFRAEQKGQRTSDGAIRRLAKRIAPATIEELICVSEADQQGRGPFLDKNHANQFLLPAPYLPGPWLSQRAQELGVDKALPRPIIQGRDLIALGFEPGISFHDIISLANTLRDDRNFTRESLLAHLAGVSTAADALALLGSLAASKT